MAINPDQGSGARAPLPPHLDKRLENDIAAAIDRGDLGHAVDEEMKSGVIESFKIYGPLGPHMVKLSNSADPKAEPLRKVLVGLGQQYQQERSKMLSSRGAQTENMQLGVRSRVNTQDQAEKFYQGLEQKEDQLYEKYTQRAVGAERALEKVDAANAYEQQMAERGRSPDRGQSIQQ